MSKEILIVILLFVYCRSNAQNTSFACNDWSTFYGGSVQDEIKGICSDNAGNIYITGTTNSNNFPVTPGLLCDTLKGDYDAFVAKFDSCGNLLWSTFAGSTDFDSGEKIIALSNGDVVICGSTFGNDFPSSTGSYQQSNSGAYDAFIMRFDSNGALMWSTHFGSTGSDLAYDITKDVNENIYVGGSTSSNNLPTDSLSLQQNIGGALDAFIVSFTSNGNFRWCTYYGGSGTEDTHVLRSDKYGNIYMAGGTFSQNIVMSNGAFQQYNNGGMEIYLLKIDSGGAELWSTYLGGAGLDDCYALVTDSAANVYLSGLTYSSAFPVTPGCIQDTLNQYSDIYLTKFSATGSLMWSTFLGGSDLEDCKSISINAAQEVTLLGRTLSADIPLAGVPFQDSLAGDYDLYIARFDSAGQMLFGTYFGGTFEEIPNSIISAGVNYCYAAGATYSNDYPTVTGSFQTNIDSLEEGIITKFYLPTNSTLSSKNDANKIEIVLYPNPAVDEMRFDTDEKIELITVRDLNGKTVFARKITNEKSIDLKSLNSGIYIIELKTSSAILRKKLIKE